MVFTEKPTGLDLPFWVGYRLVDVAFDLGSSRDLANAYEALRPQAEKCLGRSVDFPDGRERFTRQIDEIAAEKRGNPVS